jgi:hypothetical protein
VYRTIIAALLLVPALVACGAEPERPSASPSSPSGETLLARAGDSLLAVDGRTGRTVQRLPLGAHDVSFSTLFTARIEGDATVVTATDPASGRLLRSIDVPGRWTIPVAAGSAPDGAVSGDGRMLALAGPSGDALSQFALLGTDLRAQPERFTVRGRYEFDAMAPDGSALYLSEIHADGRYRVRAYDVASHRLRPRVVVEKTNLGLLMQGVPVARAVDPSGSPVHTLYRGGPEGAFVHSLDTAAGAALCIFLPDTEQAGPEWALSLDPTAGELHALDRERDAHYVIDPFTGEVSPAEAGAPRPGLEATSPDGARTYAVERGGTIAVRDRAGKRIGTLPSPGADLELVAVRG